MLVCLAMATPAMATAARPWHARPISRPSPATTVTVFVQTTLALRALVIEGALTTATRHLLGTYPRESNALLVRVLNQQAVLLTGVSHDLTGLLPPHVGALPTLQLSRLIEDLALVGDDLASTLQETVAAVSGTSLSEEQNGGMEGCVSYSPRVRHAVATLGRAEGWLETIDHETGAQATLPGFAPGEQPIERQLGLR
jgi:hypothetical protein